MIKIFYDVARRQTWVARIVSKGEAYSSAGREIHLQEEALVEFFDPRFELSNLGQYVSAYYVSTLTQSVGGLVFDEGVPGWAISTGCMDRVRTWLESQIGANCQAFDEAPVAEDEFEWYSIIVVVKGQGSERLDFPSAAERLDALREIVHKVSIKTDGIERMFFFDCYSSEGNSLGYERLVALHDGERLSTVNLKLSIDRTEIADMARGVVTA